MTIKKTAWMLGLICLAAQTARAGCTAGVADGRVTFDGRPLCWKLRNNPIAINDVHYFAAGVQYSAGLGPAVYSYLGMGPGTTPVNQGLSSSGTAIGWNVVGSSGWAPLHHYALGMASSVGQINTYLTNMTTIDTYNYFIDAAGDAFLWESVLGSPPQHWGYDTRAPARADQWLDVDNLDGDNNYATGTDVSLSGWVVRPNAPPHYSTNGADLISQADPRYRAARQAVGALVYNNGGASALSAKQLALEFFRNNGISFRNTTVSSMITHGVLPGEDPRLSTMWTALGHTETSIFVPVWILGVESGGANTVPAYLEGDDGVCSFIPSMNMYTNGSFSETNMQLRTLPVEAHFFDTVTDKLLPVWRSRNWSDTNAVIEVGRQMKRVQERMDADAYSLLWQMYVNGPTNYAPTGSRISGWSADGLSVALTASVTDVDGTITNVLWNYGDGQTGTGTAHTYAAAGTYLAGQTVTDNSGVSFTDWTFVTVPSVSRTLTAGVNDPARGSVSSTGGVYQSGTLVEITATPAPGYRLTGWSGDLPPNLTLRNPLSLMLDQDRSVTAVFAANVTYTLTVNPDRGAPSPSAGANQYTNGTVLNCSLADPVFLIGNTQYVCTGWTLDSHEPAAGSGTSFQMTLTNNAELIWLWTTNILPPLATNTLTVVSARGTPSPSAGDHLFVNTQIVSCVMNGSPIVNGRTQIVCTGWTLTGNAPVSGSGTSFNLVLTNRATLTWLWETNLITGLAVTNRIKIDFGSPSYTTDGSWNDMVNDTAGTVLYSLIASDGETTPVSLNIADDFLATATSGTTSPAPSLGYPASATRDYFYGSSANPTAALVLSNLSSAACTLTFFASRTSSTDNRQTEYRVEGATVQTVYLDAANNTQKVAVVSNMTPSANGTIRIDLQKGPANNNVSGYFYIGVLDIGYVTYEPSLVTLQAAPNNLQYGSVSPGYGEYDEGTGVEITAAASNYYHFVNWTGDLGGSTNPVTVTMTASKNITAVFAENLVTNSTPQWWLASHGLETNDSAALATGANGLKVWESYIAGLNPTNPASIFLMSDLRPLIAGNTLQWQGVSGRVYNVYWTSNLLNGFAEVLHSNITGGAFTDSLHSADQQGFYRLEVQLEP